MNTKRILLALLFFILFARVPVIYVSDKKFWAPAWMAYLGIIAGGDLSFVAFCIAVIAAQISLSVGCAVVIDRIFTKKRK